MVWLRNTVRNRLKSSMLGRILQRGPVLAGGGKVRVVSATRLDQKAFWKTSALGRSLTTWRNDPRLLIEVAFENRRGLPAVYNAAIDRAGPRDVLLFAHDDIWLDDPKWLDKLLVALKRFDVVGVAGNRRRVKNQVAWLFLREEKDGFFLDAPNLSGAVAHGAMPGGEVSEFGPSPMHCELLDGLFIAMRNDVGAASGARFDERFQFQFYDLDFCRTARSRGLSVGTWPIALTHQSRGAFKSEAWREGLASYLAKWGG
ncbi:MAG TPA: glycosyltransferase [Ramlibacter sp.]|nr:glycosyltransferase [Ramlibacter sp.]